jgi:hypothetical protein
LAMQDFRRVGNYLKTKHNGATQVLVYSDFLRCVFTCHCIGLASIRLGRRWCCSAGGGVGDGWEESLTAQWLRSPTREWQSLPHLEQMKAEGCWDCCCLCFPLALLVMAASSLAASEIVVPCRTALPQASDRLPGSPMC